ncbi:fungal trichothecene efflux pump-domain-containing protein [Aspergillus spectabilis]
MDKCEHDVVHQEHLTTDYEQTIGQTVQSPTIPSSYFTNKLFLGSLMALGLGMFSGTASFSLIAPILPIVNADIGPNANYTWVGLVNTLMLAVGYTIVGRLSDLCGRSALVRLAASVQTSPTFLLAELIPMKQRFLATGLMYLWVVPGTVFGPAISYGFLLHTAAGWRWVYYLLIISNGLATLCWTLFYYPPTYVMINSQSRLRMVRKFDYIGFVLFNGGLLIFLIGLSWGGSVHPWNSSYVIGTIVCGALALVSFVIYEHHVSIPLIPMTLFKNRAWIVCSKVMALTSSVFYGFSLISPRMVFEVYTSDLGYGSILCCAVPGGFILGIVFSALSRYIGKQKWQVIIAAIIAAPLVTSAACATTDNKSTVLGLSITGSFFFGYIEGVSTTGTSLTVPDQSGIGVSVGVASTMRATMATIASTIYVVVLANRLATTVPEYVPPALLSAGLPPSSVPAFLQNYESGIFKNIPGMTPAIIDAGTSAYRVASGTAFRTIFFTTLAFSGPTLILAVLFPNMDSKMTDEVAVLLRNKEERAAAIEAIRLERGPRENCINGQPTTV